MDVKFYWMDFFVTFGSIIVLIIEIRYKKCAKQYHKKRFPYEYSLNFFSSAKYRPDRTKYRFASNFIDFPIENAKNIAAIIVVVCIRGLKMIVQEIS